LGNGIVKSEINLENIGILRKHTKIVVTGPHRSGTTISAIIIADMLNYKFINENDYDGNDPMKFRALFMTNEKMVIQNTSFLRDMHLIDACKVLVKRDTNDILESYENTFKFGHDFNGGIFASIDDNAQKVILNHFGHKSGCIPDILYKHFEDKNDTYYVIKYDSLKSHKLFIKKETRRSQFTHIKQTEELWI
jgi:hypothetical protein